MSMVRKLPNLFVNLHQTALGRLRKWVSDAYSIRAGAVPNRTYRVGAKRLQTAPTGLELSSYKPHWVVCENGYRTHIP